MKNKLSRVVYVKTKMLVTIEKGSHSDRMRAFKEVKKFISKDSSNQDSFILGSSGAIMGLVVKKVS